MVLSERQRQILRLVVADFIRSGQPVGSRHLTDLAGLDIGPSTVRAELHRLEEAGLLDHPHTSAGRIPTQAGYRVYADELVRSGGALPISEPLAELEAPDSHSEIDVALQGTAEALSQVTNLLAVVTSPAPSTVQVRHVEVLVLQPQVVMVVVITATGAIAKRTVAFDESIDPGLAAWARTALNEQLAGRTVGPRALRQIFEDPGLGAVERAFLGAVRPVFDDLATSEGGEVHVGGASRLLGELREQNVDHLEALMARLEERVVLLAMLRRIVSGADAPGGVIVRIGDELADPILDRLALVAGRYGIGHRPLGTVTVLGPTRMDYARAISTVRAATARLNEVVDAAYTGS
jgi:heat-inducible transcriptional repressor